MRPTSTKISTIVLIRMYKHFKNNPFKIFCRKDFGKDLTYKRIIVYLKTLVRLNIIEQVPAIYTPFGQLRKDIMAWKYKLHNDNIHLNSLNIK